MDKPDSMAAGKLMSPMRNREKRMQGIEFLRILSAIGIIGFHARAPFSGVYYAGLIFFLIISPLIDVSMKWHHPRKFGLLAKALLIPWVFWIFAYGAVNLALGKPILPHGFTILGVLSGTGLHLWFLPFLFVALLVIQFAKRNNIATPLFWVSVAVGGVMLATAVFWRPAVAQWPLPLPQWLHAIPAICIGIAIGAWRLDIRYASAGIALLLGGLLVAVGQQVAGVAIPYGVAVLATIVTLGLASHWPFPSLNVQPLADCMFGVFLVHLITLPVASRIVGLHTTESVVLAFVLAVAVVWPSRRFIPASRLVLG